MDLNLLTESQKAALKQFRDAVKDCKLPDNDDIYILRWLIARDFDLTKAERMLRNSMEWRRQYRVDTLLEEFESPEVLSKYFAAGFVGRDKQHNPVVVVRYGRSDMKGILSSAKKKDYLYHVIALVEETLIMPKKDPKRYGRSPNIPIQSTIIFDMDQFSMRHITFKPGMDAAIQLVQLYEANYPELLRRVFVINAPKVFSIAYAMVKPFLQERTKNKISIFSHEPKQWKAAILAEVDPDELPVCYGGTKTDPDGNPNCITMANMGGEVPKSYYFDGKLDATNKRMLTVSNGCKELLEFEVGKSKNVLKWSFHSEDSDISFAVYQKQNSELIPIVPRDRVDCHMYSEEGEISCDEPGVYVVEFDNSYSYLRKKTIWYAITVEPASIAGQNGNNLDGV